MIILNIKSKSINNSTYYLFLLFIVFASCKKSSDEGVYPCLDGNCDARFDIPGSTLDKNNYYHIKWQGKNYFQIIGSLDKLASDYVLNGVPLIETGFDSDYWVFFDSVFYRYPLYSYLGVYSDKRYNDPIPIGSATYTLVDITNLYPPFNISGYEIPKKFTGWDKPYAVTMIGTYSKYTYNPTQNIFFCKEMRGDTVTIFTSVKFNCDVGRSVVVTNKFFVIFE